MPYRTWTTGDTVTAADFNAVTADPSTADVVTSQSTTSTSYTDLATSGPAVTLTLVSGQTCLVIVAARVSSAGGTIGPIASFAVSGASTLAASDANGVENDGASWVTLSKATLFTASATGSHTFTMKYKVTNAGTGNFIERRIIVKKF